VIPGISRERTKTKPGIFPQSPLEETLFIIFNDPNTIILADKDEPGILFMGKEPDLCYLHATL
jgi:hypothetical protein